MLVEPQTVVHMSPLQQQQQQYAQQYTQHPYGQLQHMSPSGQYGQQYASPVQQRPVPVAMVSGRDVGWLKFV